MRIGLRALIGISLMAWASRCPAQAPVPLECPPCPITANFASCTQGGCGSSTIDCSCPIPGGPRGYQVLSAAAQGTVGSQLALAQHLGVDRTVMTYLLDNLEKQGLIERRPDPADRRARRILATEGGADLLATLDDRLRAAEDSLLAPLDPAAREVFRGQIRVLATRIDAGAGLPGCRGAHDRPARVRSC